MNTSPSLSRFEAVQFTVAVDYTYFVSLGSKPKPFYSWKVIFHALNVNVWLLVFLSLFVAMVSIVGMENVSRLSNKQHAAIPWVQGLFSRFLELTRYLTGQNAGDAPESYSSKLVYVCWLFYGLIIGTAYSSSLQAMIVSPGYGIEPRTFLDLLSTRLSQDYKWGAAASFRDGLGGQLLKYSKNPTLRSIYENMEGDKNSLSCMERIRHEGYACFNWEVEQKFYLATRFTDKFGQVPFQYGTDSAFPIPMSQATRKRELFVSHFNKFVQTCFDWGIVQQLIALDTRKYRKELMQKNGNTFKNDDAVEGAVALSLVAVLGCFIVLTIGLVICIVTFAAEVVHYTWFAYTSTTLPTVF